MELLDIYEQMAVKIIAVQEAIIGPLAISQASSVPGLILDWDAKTVAISGSGKDVIEHLIESYKDLFGLSSVEVSKDAVSNLSHLLSPEEVPELLAA